MDSVQKALETQLQNIQTKTGKSLEELAAFVQKSGLTKHGQIRDMLKRELSLGHGDANTLTHYVRDPKIATRDEEEDVLERIYAHKKAHLRPIHDKLMAAINKFGDFTISPKKTYVSLRRKKQFAMIGPATNTRVDVGLNNKELVPHERLTANKSSMCDYKVKVVNPDEVDDELLGWIEQAYHSAG